MSPVLESPARKIPTADKLEDYGKSLQERITYNTVNSLKLAKAEPYKIRSAMKAELDKSMGDDEKAEQTRIGLKRFIDENKDDLASIGLKREYDSVRAYINGAANAKELVVVCNGLRGALSSLKKSDPLSAMVIRDCLDEKANSVARERDKLIMNSARDGMVSSVADPFISRGLGVDIAEIAKRNLAAPDGLLPSPWEKQATNLTGRGEYSPVDTVSPERKLEIQKNLNALVAGLTEDVIIKNTAPEVPGSNHLVHDHVRPVPGNDYDDMKRK